MGQAVVLRNDTATIGELKCLISSNHSVHQRASWGQHEKFRRLHSERAAGWNGCNEHTSGLKLPSCFCTNANGNVSGALIAVAVTVGAILDYVGVGLPLTGLAVCHAA